MNPTSHEELVENLVEDGTQRSIGCGRGRGQEDANVEELQELRERIEAMKRFGLHLAEASDDEESTEEIEPKGDINPVILFKFVLVASYKPQLEALMYDGSLNEEELIN